MFSETTVITGPGQTWCQSRIQPLTGIEWFARWGSQWWWLATTGQLEVRRCEESKRLWSVWLSGCLTGCNFTMLLLSDKNVENAGGNNGWWVARGLRRQIIIIILNNLVNGDTTPGGGHWEGGRGRAWYVPASLCLQESWQGAITVVTSIYFISALIAREAQYSSIAGIHF